MKKDKLQTRRKYFQTIYVTKDLHLEHVKNTQNSIVKNPNNLIRKLANDMKKRFTKDDILMANKHMKRYSTSLALGKLKLKPQYITTYLSEWLN